MVRRHQRLVLVAGRVRLRLPLVVRVLWRQHAQGQQRRGRRGDGEERRRDGGRRDGKTGDGSAIPSDDVSEEEGEGGRCWQV